MKIKVGKGVSESEFFMWRAVFAFSLVDQVLSMEEQAMLHSYFSSISFSPAQLEIFKNDFLHPQNVQNMYGKITEHQHKERFCVLARALAWCEGDMDRQETMILQRVGCMKGTPDEDILHRSRDESHLHDYYQHYARAGMLGLVKAHPQMQLRA